MRIVYNSIFPAPTGNLALNAAVEDRARELAGLVERFGWPFEDAVRNLKATTCFGPATIERTVARARELMAHYGA